MSDEAPNPARRKTAWARIGKTGPAWARITVDPEIPHGAARMFFYLLNVCRNEKTGATYPSQGTIARDIGCDIHSIMPWTKKLTERGYLQAEKSGQDHHWDYSFPHLELGKPTNRGESRIVSNHTADCGNPQGRDCRICPKEPYPKEPKTTERGARRVELSGAERISLDKELERIDAKVKAIHDGASHDAWGPKFDDDEKKQLRELRTRRKDILQKLGAVA